MTANVTKTQKIVALVLIVVLGLVLRLRGLNRVGLNEDEVHKVEAARALPNGEFLGQPRTSHADEVADCNVSGGPPPLCTLGYAASEGVSLAIIRKIRIVFWAALGLLFAAKYSMARPVGEEGTI
jgi:hypothetical protein